MSPKQQRTRIWDLPTRIFHWSLVACITGAFVTVKAGTLWMDWHVRFGHAVLALVVFRVIWGLAGPRHARFSSFLKGPRAITRYLSDRSTHLAGHNPLGGWSVMLMLALFGFQALSGLFTTDDILSSGPLAHLNGSWSATFGYLHKLAEWLMIVVLALHVIAVLWYQFALRKNLVGPMVHGDLLHPSSAAVKPSSDTRATRLLALILIMALAIAAWWLSSLGGNAGIDFM